MKRRFTYLIGIVLLMSLVSCASIYYGPSETSIGPRTLVLSGDTINVENYGGIQTWTCKDYTDGGGVLVEVGYFEISQIDGLGFILYDGTYSGDYALYQREGLDRSWIWGDKDEEVNYKFVIKTDGTGAYFDFSNVPEGESTKASEIYNCKQR